MAYRKEIAIKAELIAFAQAQAEMWANLAVELAEPQPDPQPEPDPEPTPDPTPVVLFDDMPGSWVDDTVYAPRDPARVYSTADLRGTVGVTLKDTTFMTPVKTSRYTGAVKLGVRTVIDGCTFDGGGSLCIEMNQGSDDCVIRNSSFVDNDYNAIWSHAWHRNYGVTIENCFFRNNNSKLQALNWDAADIKLLHHLNVVVKNNIHAGGWGDAIWLDSDAQGMVFGNTITGPYAHGIFVEMANRDLGETLVFNNTIDGAGFQDNREWIWGAAILLSGSTGVKVYNNTVTNSRFDYSVVGISRPDHEDDRVHATYGETHRPDSGYNEVDTNGSALHIGGFTYWLPENTNTFVAPTIVRR